MTSKILCLLLLFAASLAAQTVNGRIVGNVSDASGAMVPGAAVTVRHLETNVTRSAVTSDAGSYVIPNLQIGSYEVTVELAGFKRHVRGPVRLDVDQTARIDVQLETGDIADKITVEGGAAAVQTDQSSLGQVIENQTITQLPLNGRNFIRLGSLLPGTTRGAPGNSVVRGRQEGEALTVNGQRAEHNNYMLDGADNNETLFGVAVMVPSVDALQEFKVQTANYSAEFGRAAGAVINVSIKSGTNEVHGAAYEFLRNNAMDARDFFALGTPPLRRNQFGFSLGGPIVKNKLFLFGNWEALKERRANTRGFLVPSAALRNGDFSGLATLYDPATQTGTGPRTPFPGNRIPDTRIHAVSRKILPLWPAANNPDPARPYVQNFNNPLDRDAFHLRGDYHLRSSDQFMARVSSTDTEDRNPSIAFSGDSTNNKHKSGVVGWTHIFSPAMLNDARFSATLYRFELLPDGLGTDYASQLGLPSFAISPGILRHPTVSIRNIQGVGGNDAIPLFRKEISYQWVDQFTWIRGKQTLKAGIDARRFQTNNFQPQTSMGNYTFNGPFTAQTGQTYANGFGDFLLGLPQQQRILIPVGFDANRLRNTRMSLYLQDDVNVTSRLTINAGLRWERDGNWTEKNNRWAYFDFSRGEVVYPKALSIPFTIPYPHRQDDITSMKPPTNKAFAPRFGFAWRPFGGNRTVVRGAYGIFWAQPIANIMLNTALTPPPFLLRQDLVSSAARPELQFGVFPGASADQFVPRNPSLFTQNPFDFSNGYVQQWNFALERELVRNWVGQMSYVGSKGTHLERRYEGNPALPPRAGSLNDRRAYPIFRSLTLQNSNSFSTYHSLQLKAERRYRNGLSILGGYTYSKSLDDTSAWTGLGGQESQFAQDPSRLFLEKGRSGFDVRQRLTMTFLYDLPVHFQMRWAEAVLGGWQMSGILTLQSGFPLTATVGGDIPNAGTGTTRPDLVAAPNLDPSQRNIDRWFNTAAFRAPAPFTFGSAGRNILDGPGQRAFDFSMMKFFAITERHKLQFRGEFFNFPNHANFGLPNASFGNAAFGTIRSASGGREVQLALKYTF